MQHDQRLLMARIERLEQEHIRLSKLLSPASTEVDPDSQSQMLIDGLQSEHTFAMHSD